MREPVPVIVDDAWTKLARGQLPDRSSRELHAYRSEHSARDHAGERRPVGEVPELVVVVGGRVDPVLEDLRRSDGEQVIRGKVGDTRADERSRVGDGVPGIALHRTERRDRKDGQDERDDEHPRRGDAPEHRVTPSPAPEERDGATDPHDHSRGALCREAPGDHERGRSEQRRGQHGRDRSQRDAVDVVEATTRQRAGPDDSQARERHEERQCCEERDDHCVAAPLAHRLGQEPDEAAERAQPVAHDLGVHRPPGEQRGRRCRGARTTRSRATTVPRRVRRRRVCRARASTRRWLRSS